MPKTRACCAILGLVKWKDLEQRFGKRVDLTPLQWAFALLLGEARQQSNAGRAARSDRGRRGNQAVDLHGALGELWLYGAARSLPDSADAASYMRSQLFCAAGGRDVTGADLLFEDAGRPIGIDVKTFDCAKNKSFFAINDNKHSQLAGQCFAYMGLVCPAWARKACVMFPIPYADVSTWECSSLRPGGSDSRNLPIGIAMQRYGCEGYSIEDSRRDVYSKQEIRDLACETGEGSPIAALSRLLPDAAPYLAKAQAAL